MATLKEQQEAKKARIAAGAEAIKKPAKPAGVLRHIHIHPASNGMMVETARGDLPATNTVFSGDKAKQQVIDHISKHLDD